MRGHEDKRLPVVVVAAIVEQVGQDLTRAQDKAALLSRSRMSKAAFSMAFSPRE